MNFLVNLFNFFDKKMPEPTNYGWFHLLFMALIVTTTVLLCMFFKDCKDKTMRKIVLIFWLTITTLEVYKQFNFGFSVSENKLVWDYAWYAFPFQLCSTPLYAMPFVVFLKDGKIRDAFIAYMGAFSFFGGLAVFFYPNDVFVETIGINIQTMVHHGTQVIIGIFLLVHQRKKLGIFHYLKAVPVFAGFSAIAILLNEITVASGLEDTFNMFYISRHYDCTLPVLSAIYPNVPYVVFLLMYLLGFVIVSIIMYYAQFGINKMVKHFKKKSSKCL